MTWFEKIMPSRVKTERRTRSVPEGLWVKCPACDAVLYRAELERNLQVSPKCTHHMRFGARDRLQRFLDAESQQELAVDVEPEDPLKFRDSKKYRDRLNAAQKHTAEKDALVVMVGTVRGLELVACAFEFRFLGGSMGSVYASPTEQRHGRNGVVVRVIEYRLEGVPGAEPLDRLLTTVLDPAAAPALGLAALYHERWEIETALDELKTHLRGARIVLRQDAGPCQTGVLWLAAGPFRRPRPHA